MPTHHDVAAGARQNRVGTTHAEGDRFDPAHRDGQTAEAWAVGRRRDDLAAVADDDVAAIARVDPITCRTADDDVVAGETGDGIAAADAEGEALDPVDVARVAVTCYVVH